MLTTTEIEIKNSIEPKDRADNRPRATGAERKEPQEGVRPSVNDQESNIDPRIVWC